MATTRCYTLVGGMCRTLRVGGGPGWPAPGFADTELGVLMELEVGHGNLDIYAGVQALRL